MRARSDQDDVQGRRDYTHALADRSRAAAPGAAAAHDLEHLRGEPGRRTLTDASPAPHGAPGESVAVHTRQLRLQIGALADALREHDASGSTVAAHAIRTALATIEHAISREPELEAPCAELRDQATALLAAAFTPSRAALDEAQASTGRSQWDREVAAWTATAALQRKSDGSMTATGDVTATAARGIAGAASDLPHAATIQRAFGRHDVSSVRVQIGGPAATAAHAIGARAYAMGATIAFATQPDLETAAHEAAHVVQQRAGALPAGSIGVAGDALEQHADRVATGVVEGRSVEALLDEVAGSGARGHAVQRKADDTVTVGNALGVVPHHLDLGQVEVGSISTPIDVLFYTAGSEPIIVDSLRVEPTGGPDRRAAAGEFEIAGPIPTTIVSGQPAKLDVTFRPHVAREATADLTLVGHSWAGRNSRRATLVGIGIAPTAETAEARTLALAQHASLALHTGAATRPRTYCELLAIVFAARDATVRDDYAHARALLIVVDARFDELAPAADEGFADFGFAQGPGNHMFVAARGAVQVWLRQLTFGSTIATGPHVQQVQAARDQIRYLNGEQSDIPTMRTFDRASKVTAIAATVAVFAPAVIGAAIEEAPLFAYAMRTTATGLFAWATANPQTAVAVGHGLVGLAMQLDEDPREWANTLARFKDRDECILFLAQFAGDAMGVGLGQNEDAEILDRYREQAAIRAAAVERVRAPRAAIEALAAQAPRAATTDAEPPRVSEHAPESAAVVEGAAAAKALPEQHAHAQGSVPVQMVLSELAESSMLMPAQRAEQIAFVDEWVDDLGEHGTKERIVHDLSPEATKENTMDGEVRNSKRAVIVSPKGAKVPGVLNELLDAKRAAQSAALAGDTVQLKKAQARVRNAIKQYRAAISMQKPEDARYGAAVSSSSEFFVKYKMIEKHGMTNGQIAAARASAGQLAMQELRYNPSVASPAEALDAMRDDVRQLAAQTPEDVDVSLTFATTKNRLNDEDPSRNEQRLSRDLVDAWYREPDLQRGINGFDNAGQEDAARPPAAQWESAAARAFKNAETLRDHLARELASAGARDALAQRLARLRGITPEAARQLVDRFREAGYADALASVDAKAAATRATDDALRASRASQRAALVASGVSPRQAAARVDVEQPWRVAYPTDAAGTLDMRFGGLDVEQLAADTRALTDALRIWSAETHEQHARVSLLGMTGHAGEQILSPHIDPFGLLDQVEQQLAMGSDRIGHGLILGLAPEVLVDKGRLPRDQVGAFRARQAELVQRIKARGVVIEANISSNTEISNLTKDEHPAGKLVTEGLRVTVNTDDETVLATDIRRELTRAAQAPGVDTVDTTAMILEGYDSRLGNRELASAGRVKLALQRVFLEFATGPKGRGFVDRLARRFDIVPQGSETQTLSVVLDRVLGVQP